MKCKAAMIWGLLACVWTVGCGGRNSGSNVVPPGAEKTARTGVLETGTALLQSKAPLGALNVYMDGFHFYNGDRTAQMEAHHYCSVVNEDLNQCVIFDGNGRDAKLMGVEYIVSRKLFDTFPLEEKQLWHSHVYEVKSGQLIAPGVPQAAEHAFMDKMADTYGKTWHTWHTDRGHTLPSGHPMLMMGFTADGQINEAMVADRDRRFRTSTPEKRRNRSKIAAATSDLAADSWKSGRILQLSLSESSSK